MKKKIMVLFAVLMMMFAVSPLALAEPTPEPNAANNTIQTNQIAQNQPVTQTEELENSKYLTKGGAAFWFILTIILNSALSFWIGNRFYRLSKKDNHLSAEIRALKKDVDEKFVRSVGGFAEQEIDISNTNESLAMDEDGIRPADKQPIVRDAGDEKEERFRKWEEAQSRPKGERTRPRSVVREELREDFDDVKRIKRKNYQPKREHDDDFDNDDDLGETKAINLSRGEGVKSKAKEILGDIFPFKED